MVTIRTMASAMSDYPPILESVFDALAPDADSIGAIATRYPLVPLSYRELADWSDELAAGIASLADHAGTGYPSW